MKFKRENFLIEACSFTFSQRERESVHEKEFFLMTI